MMSRHADRNACKCQKDRLYGAGTLKKIFGKLLGLFKFVTVKNCLQAAPLHPPTLADKLQKELIRWDSIWNLAVKKE